LDELWALAPFLAVEQIGAGLALAITAALLYLPFSQRSLLLMGEGRPKHV
jgi:cholera toxin transcriptional activator